MTGAPAAALRALRAERPALAMAASFAPPRDRELVAALLLLWMELLRAGQASEPLLAATRMAWWRDALRERAAEGVPLAESLVALGMADQLADAIDAMVAETMQSDRPVPPHAAVAGILAPAIGVEAEAAASLLGQLAGAFGGRAAEPARIAHPALALVQWCCRKPARLDYPDRRPLLALEMLWASIRL